MLILIKNYIYSYISVYSLFNAIIWFTLSIGIGNLILKISGLYWKTTVFIFVLGSFRLLFPIEHKFMHIFRLNQIYFYKDFLNVTIFNIKIWNILLFVCLIGGIIFSSTLIAKLYHLKQICRQSKIIRPDNTLYSLCRSVAREMEYTGRFKISISDEFPSAVSAGYFMPHIIIPKSILSLPEKQLRFIFKHEMVHYLKGDLWIKIILLFIRSFLWWFYPIYSFTTNCERLLEMRCDYIVSKNMDYINIFAYMEAMQNSLSTSVQTLYTPLAYVEFSNKSFLKKRLDVLSENNSQSRFITKKTIFIVTLSFLVFVLSYTFTIQPGKELDDKYMAANNMWVMPDEENNKPFLLQLTENQYILMENGVSQKYLTREQLSDYANLEIIPAE